MDLDGDGAIDVVSCCEGKTNAVFVHWAPERHAHGSSIPRAWKTEPFPPCKGMCQWMFCEPMQIDGKHGIDLVVGGKNKDGQIGWLEAPPNPRDLAAWKYHPLIRAGWIMSLVAVDMNGDKHLDIARLGPPRQGLRLPVAGESRSRSAIRPSRGRSHRIGPAGDEVMFLDVADLDSDGKLDVLVPTFDRKLHFFRQKSAHRLGTAPHRLPARHAAAARRSAWPTSTWTASSTWSSPVPRPKGLHGIVWMSYRKSAFDEAWDAHEISGLEGIKFDLIQLLDLDGDGDLDVINTEEAAAGAGRGLGVVWYENPTR